MVNDTGYIGTRTVNGSGQIVLDDPVTSVEAGFNFVPTALTLPPEVALSDGPTLGQPRRIVRTVLQTYESVNVKVGRNIYSIRRAEDDLSAAPTPENRNMELWNLGWDTKGQIRISCPDPVPFTLLGLLLEIEF